MYNRKSIRIKDYDYSNEGLYFITICTYNKEKILSKITKKVQDKDELVTIELTDIGILVEQCYLNIINKFPNIQLHDYVIMPNHMHIVIEITKKKINRVDTRPTPTIANVICAFKSITTYEITKGVKEGKYKPYKNKIWQRNYYEHIIRNEKEYLRILEYIQNNPLNWALDKYY